jgi:hypothetical protein
MNIVAHLIRHDIRALRLPLLGWLLILLTQGVVIAAAPRFLEPTGPGGLFIGFADFLAGTRFALTILLTVLLVQRDSPIGTTAFWLTRPIPPLAMAAGKLCSAALLMLGLPAALEWALFSALGLPQADLADGIGQLLLEQTVLVCVSALGAAVTASIPQFAVATVAAMVFMGALANALRPYGDRLAAMSMPVEYSPISAWALTTAAGTVAVMAFQYARRRVVPAAAAGTGVLMIGMLGALMARAPLDAHPPAPLRTGVLDPGAVTLGLDPLALRVESGSPVDRQVRQARHRYATAILHTAGAPPAIVLQPWSVDSVWHPAGASPISWQRVGAGYRTDVRREAEADGQPLRSIALSLGRVELLRPMRSELTAFRTTLLSLPEERVSRLSPAQGPLDATVTLRAWRYRVDQSVPVAVGSSLSARHGRLTVRATGPSPGGIHVDLRCVFVERSTWMAEDQIGEGGNGMAERIVLMNKSRTQAVLPAAESFRQIGYGFPGGISGLQLGTGVRRLSFVVRFGDDDRTRLDEEWLKGAELVVLRPEDLGAFTKPLRVDWVNLENVK